MITKEEFPEGAEVGQELDVWVQAIRDDGKVTASTTPIKSIEVVRDSLVRGQKLHGIILRLYNGGAFVDVGADRDFYIPAKHLREDMTPGRELNVWVKEIRSSGDVTLTTRAPYLDINSVVVGQELHGEILRIPEFGGAFVDVGAVDDIYVPSTSLADGAKVGEKIDVWVKEIKSYGKFTLTPQAPKCKTKTLTRGYFQLRLWWCTLRAVAQHRKS